MQPGREWHTHHKHTNRLQTDGEQLGRQDETVGLVESQHVELLQRRRDVCRCDARELADLVDANRLAAVLEHLWTTTDIISPV